MLLVATVSGCRTSRRLRAPSPQIISVLDRTPSRVDFGSREIGSGTVRLLSLSNPSASDYRIVEAQINDWAFTVTDIPSPFVVPAQGKTSVSVVFRPGTPRKYSGVLLLKERRSRRRQDSGRLEGRCR